MVKHQRHRKRLEELCKELRAEQHTTSGDAGHCRRDMVLPSDTSNKRMVRNGDLSEDR